MSSRIVNPVFSRDRRRMIGARSYFKKLAKTYHVEGLDPDAVQAAEQPIILKRGPAESRLGGRITRDLTCLSPEEIERRMALSEDFLKQPVVRFPADETVGS